MADATTGSGAPSSNRNIMIVLSYLWLLALVPLLTEKDDKEVQWHAKHGLVLAVAELVLWVGVGIFTQITFTVFGPLGCLISLFMPIFGLAVMALHLMCIIKGINGQRLVIPGLTQYVEKF